MALLEIKKYPEKILKQKTADVDNIDGNLQRLIDDMMETMYAARGLGLAANQVGFQKRLCVIDTSLKEEKKSPLILINPVISEIEGFEEAEEGCLSIPGYILKVKRSAKVLARALDKEGKTIEIEATGLLARALQHEIDHLNGLLIIDRINPIKRELLKRQIKKSLTSPPTREAL
jgi:peptide deformylase